MAIAVQSSFEARKTPVQARSAVTVEAIGEATIQVLLLAGPERLTTTRVAERAGVSVGTLYQYYPNKQALLFAVLEQHLEKVADAVETACKLRRHEDLESMVRGVVNAMVDAKMERTDISMALYKIAADVGGKAVVERMGKRSRRALAGMLETALVKGQGARFGDVEFVAQMLFAAMAGTTRMVLEAGASVAMVKKLREQLVVMCLGYLTAAMER